MYFWDKVDTVMREEGISRSEACKILGKRGALAQRARPKSKSVRKKRIIHTMIKCDDLPCDVQNVGKGDLIEHLETGAQFRVEDTLGKDGHVPCSNGRGLTYWLPGDKVKVVATVDHTPISPDDFLNECRDALDS
jgi:hypothetical protein